MKKEAKKIFASQAAAAKQMRQAAARNAAATQPSLAMPAASVRQEERDLVDPETGEVFEATLFSAKFGAEARVFPSEEAAEEWVRSHREEWEREILPRKRARAAAREALRVLEKAEGERIDLASAHLAEFLNETA